MRLAIVLLLALFLVASVHADEKDFPPGWLPINTLDEKPVWSDFRKIEDKIHLYLPKDVKTVRGIFACFVFHSQDPRELADLWQFALVTVPWPFEYDLGHNDKRNGRHKLGHPVGNMSFMLKYLEVAAKETKHPELTQAPIVGWLMQNGPTLCNDLFKRAPDRVLAWTDGFPNRVSQVPEFTAKVPFAYAWEFTGKDEKERQAEREAGAAKVKGQLTPAPDFKCRANTYGFPHGIYSKFSFFASFLDRCIAARLPKETPPAGQPVQLKPWVKEEGWVGDFNPVGEWNSIAPFRDAKEMTNPVWFPDGYTAWMWRAYHTHKPVVKLTAPVIEYRKKDGKWGGPECGLGYGGIAASNTPLKFSADAPSDFTKIEFHSGDRIVGTSEKAPWIADGMKLERGLHALFAVGVKADGSRSCSRATFLVVK